MVETKVIMKKSTVIASPEYGRFLDDDVEGLREVKKQNNCWYGQMVGEVSKYWQNACSLSVERRQK